MTSFQFTVMSIPTIRRDQPFNAQGHQKLDNSPFTRGEKLGLVKALKSLDEDFETLLPRKSV